MMSMDMRYRLDCLLYTIFSVECRCVSDDAKRAGGGAPIRYLEMNRLDVAQGCRQSTPKRKPVSRLRAPWLALMQARSRRARSASLASFHSPLFNTACLALLLLF